MILTDRISLIITLVLIAAIIYTFPVIIKQEWDDVKALNKSFEKIQATNPKCVDYLQAVTSIPSWRESVLWGFSTITFIFAFLTIVISVPGISKISVLCIGYWFSLIIVIAVLYKMLNHHAWHYTCNNGCSKDSIFTK